MIYPLNKYLLNACYRSGIMLGPWDTEMNKVRYHRQEAESIEQREDNMSIYSTAWVVLWWKHAQYTVGTKESI